MDKTIPAERRVNDTRLKPTHATTVRLFQILHDAWDDVIEDCVLRGFDITSDPKVRDPVVRNQFLWHGYDLSGRETATAPGESSHAILGDPSAHRQHIANQQKGRWAAFRKRKRESYEQHLDALEHLEHGIYLQLFDNVNLSKWDGLRDTIKEWLRAVDRFTPPAPVRPSFVNEIDTPLSPSRDRAYQAMDADRRETRVEYQGLMTTANALLEEILRVDALLIGRANSQRSSSSGNSSETQPDGSYSNGRECGLRLQGREYPFPTNRHQSLRIIAAMWPPAPDKKVPVAEVQQLIGSAAGNAKWATNEASKIRDFLATIPTFRFSVRANNRDKAFWWMALPGDR